MGPRVLLDATGVPADRGALGRYVDGLVSALAEAGADLGLACQRADEERMSDCSRARIVPGRQPSCIGTRLAWEQSGLPLVGWGRGRCHPLATSRCRCGRSADRRDDPRPHFLHGPDLHSWVTATFYAAIRTSAWRATRLIVPSKATRDEVERVLEADSTKIDVAYHGVDHTFFNRPGQAQLDRVASRLGLHGRPYVAYLGTLEPRKNVPALIAGWTEAVADLAEPPALVLAGGTGWSDEVDDAVAAVPAHLRLVRPGYLHFTDLPGFFGGALIVAFPSIGEGFGLPVLEAMACGAPVLTTHRTSLPEVGGDAVAYTEPEADSIKSALRALIDDGAQREALGNAGYARSLEFTWAASAQAHMACYERAAAARQG